MQNQSTRRIIVPVFALLALALNAPAQAEIYLKDGQMGGVATTLKLECPHANVKYQSDDVSPHDAICPDRATFAVTSLCRASYIQGGKVVKYATVNVLENGTYQYQGPKAEAITEDTKLSGLLAEFQGWNDGAVSRTGTCTAAPWTNKAVCNYTSATAPGPEVFDKRYGFLRDGIITLGDQGKFKTVTCHCH